MSFLKKQQEAAKASSNNKRSNAFGLVLLVATAEDANGVLRLTGKPLSAGGDVKVDETLTIDFRGDAAGKSVTNFIKGNGKTVLMEKTKGAGAIVSLEGCYVTDETDGQNRIVSARWLNTIASTEQLAFEKAKADAGEKIATRSFIEGVYANAPRISFKNPKPQAGEPDNISFPVNATEFKARVKSDGGTFQKTFPAQFAIEKLKELPQDAKPQVTIDIVQASEAVRINNREELEAALKQQLSAGTKALSMLRVSDGDDVATRLVYGSFKKEGDSYVPDADKVVEELFKNNIFKGVGNEVLLGELKAGGLVVEVIPGYRMNYAGDPTKDDNAAYALLTSAKKGEGQRYGVMFGEDADNFAKVIIAGLARTNDISGFSPFNVIAGEQGLYQADGIPTAHIKPGAAPKQTAEVPEAPDFAALDEELPQAEADAEHDAAGPRP